MPVSLTAKRTVAWSSLCCARVTRTTISPRSVNLTALPTRFRRTCPSRPASPRTARGTSAWMSEASSSPLAAARGAWTTIASSRTALRLNSRTSSSSLPASILEKSRMSLMTVSRFSEQRRTVVRKSRCSGLRGVSRRRSVMPKMPFIGVRISWLMLARNSDLSRAWSRAASRACWSASSTPLRSVTSRRAAMASRCPPSSTSLTASSSGKLDPSRRRPTSSPRGPRPGSSSGTSRRTSWPTTSAGG